jgi:hypothetical protein
MYYCLSVYFDGNNKHNSKKFLELCHSSNLYSNIEYITKRKGGSECVLYPYMDKKDLNRNFYILIDILFEFKKYTDFSCTIVLAYFYNTAHASLYLDSSLLKALSEIGFDIEFVCYPCADESSTI